jgi:hypothetical protein
MILNWSKFGKAPVFPTIGITKLFICYGSGGAPPASEYYGFQPDVPNPFPMGYFHNIVSV